ncbi:acyltransferase family protein [Stomatobaculum longum]|uniref:acyltransferase family protein n=1 Tax=Stomatobaculum longum TaxID=796942 RepID=UPI0028EF82A7|nr:acyltransferase [Stomatobaculum longum]
MNERIASLDGVRGFAALFILLYHWFFIGALQGFYSKAIYIPQGFWGEFGVDVFFILSGFAILYSTGDGITPGVFLKKRLLRIYPTFFVSATFVLIMRIALGIEARGQIIAYLTSFTMMTDLVGRTPLSSIYWTLMVECKFYLLVIVIMKLGLWKEHKYGVMYTWVIASFLIKQPFITNLMILKYAGHFVMGILFYLLYYKEGDARMIPLAVLSGLGIYRNMTGFQGWIVGSFNVANYSELKMFFAMVFILAVIFAAPYYKGWGAKTEKAFALLGRLSFAFYLIHADFGSAFYKELMGLFHWNEAYIWIVMAIDFVLVTALAILTDYIGNLLTGVLRQAQKR